MKDTSAEGASLHAGLLNYVREKESASSKTAKPAFLSRPQGYEHEDGIKDRTRVVELAEVFTPGWIVEDMLKSIPVEILKEPKSRFLEPSCGNGNFIVEIVAKKLEHLIRASSNRLDLEFDALVILCSTYGIDISVQNIDEARHRIKTLFTSFLEEYSKHSLADENYLKSISYVIDSNLIHGDTLHGGENIQIIEYTYPSHQRIMRRIFTFTELQELNGSLMALPRPEKYISVCDFKEVWNVT